MKSKKSAALPIVKTCCQVLEDKKAGEVTVLDVSAQSSITDYLVIATATSEPHLRALRIELEKALDAGGVHLVGMESAQESGWMVIDAFDVMVHLFLAEARERYALERLWRDATEVAVARLVNEKPRKTATKKAPAGGKKKKTSSAKRTKR